MKNDIIYCRECKKDFTVIVNKKFKLVDKFKGLPNCKHHKKEKQNGRGINHNDNV